MIMLGKRGLNAITIYLTLKTAVIRSVLPLASVYTFRSTETVPDK